MGFMAMLGQLLDTQGCDDLHLCDASERQVESVVEAEKSVEQENGLECTLCTSIVDALQSFVENSTTLDSKVEAFLEDDFCTLLPESVQAICNSTVDSQTPATLYSLASKFLDGTTDCTAIGLCKGQAVYASAAGGSLKCTLCQKLMDFVDAKVLENPTAEAAAEKAAPGLMQLLGQFLDTQACDDIHMCDK